MELERRRVYEGRIWRLSFLLTGDARAAGELVHRVLRAQPDVLHVEPARLDRLVILQSREWARKRRRAIPADGPAMEPLAAETHRAALAMPHQLLEAWVLARIDELEGMSVSRAMDCSNTATAAHLAAADEAMRERLGDRIGAGAAALRAFADSLDPRPFIAGARGAVGGRRLLRVLFGVLIVLALLAAAWVVWRSGVVPAPGPAGGVQAPAVEPDGGRT